MRPRTKNNAQRIALTLSEPARIWLEEQAMNRGVSRTQIVEDLIAETHAAKKKEKKDK